MESIDIFKEVIGSRICPLVVKYKPYMDRFETYPFRRFFQKTGLELTTYRFCSISCIKKMILALIQIATVLSAIYVPYMWCVLILNLLVYSYPIYKAITFKPSAYKIKYDDFVKNNDGIYDDNGIMCGNDDEKLYFIYLRVAAIVVPFLNALALWLLPFTLGALQIYMIVLAVLDVIAGYIFFFV